MKASFLRLRCRRVHMVILVSLFVVPLMSLFAANDFSPSATAAYTNFALMRFFRDLARAKARRRRFEQRHALMSLMMGSEEPLPLGDASAGLALTLDELSEYDGRQLPESTERAPLLLAIRGRIYDVSAGWNFYGPGKSYHKLVAKDATRAFCTGCLEAACLIANTAGLRDSQLKEADRWIELYEHHDKYKLVGQLRTADPLIGDDDERAEAAEAAAAWEREQLQRAQDAEGSKKWRPFRLR